MKERLLILSILLTCTVAMGTSRPPVLEPNDVAFEYDPNMVQSPVMDFAMTEPNVMWEYDVAAHNNTGRVVNLSVAGVNADRIIIQRISIVNDPNDEWDQSFTIRFEVPDRERVYYLDIKAVDTKGKSDNRTVLVYAIYNDAPFLYPVRGPVLHPVYYEAGLMNQYVQTIGYPPLEKPIQSNLLKFPALHDYVVRHVLDRNGSAFCRRLYN